MCFVLAPWYLKALAPLPTDHATTAGLHLQACVYSVQHWAAITSEFLGTCFVAPKTSLNVSCFGNFTHTGAPAPNLFPTHFHDVDVLEQRLGCPEPSISSYQTKGLTPSFVTLSTRWYQHGNGH